MDDDASCASVAEGLRALRVLPAGLPDLPAVGRGDGLPARPDPPGHPDAGRRGAEPAAAEHFDRCLGCMACMTACPSGVQYDQLIEAARAWTEDPEHAPPVQPEAHLRGRRGRWAEVRDLRRCRASWSRRPGGGAGTGRCGTGRPGRPSSRCSPTRAAAGADRAAARAAAHRAGPAGGPQRPAGRLSPALGAAMRLAPPAARRGAGCRNGSRPAGSGARWSACSPAACSRCSSAGRTRPPPGCWRPRAATWSSRRIRAAAGRCRCIPAGRRRRSPSPGDHRHVRAGRGGRDRGQLGRLRLGHEGVRAAAGRLPARRLGRAGGRDERPGPRSFRVPGRAGPGRAAAPAAGPGGLPRRLPPGPRSRDHPRAARTAARHPPARAGRAGRRGNLLRVGGRVQPAAARGRRGAGRAQGAVGPDAGRRCSSRPTPAARCRSPRPWPTAGSTSRSRTSPRYSTPRSWGGRLSSLLG